MAQDFQRKDDKAKIENSPLHSFVANNIRTSHFEIGPGGQAGSTEVKSSFQIPNKDEVSRF
jgi:hypothetical protein